MEVKQGTGASDGRGYGSKERTIKGILGRKQQDVFIFSSEIKELLGA